MTHAPQATALSAKRRTKAVSILGFSQDENEKTAMQFKMTAFFMRAAGTEKSLVNDPGTMRRGVAQTAAMHSPPSG